MVSAPMKDESSHVKHPLTRDPNSPIPTPAITEELLQELRRLLEAATPGPVHASGRLVRYGETLGGMGSELPHDSNAAFAIPANARLYAFLRNHADSLLAAADRLKETEARCEVLRKALLLPGSDDTVCAQCQSEWAHDEPEHHEPDCIAAPSLAPRKGTG